jgi:hypothetical protein
MPLFKKEPSMITRREQAAGIYNDEGCPTVPTDVTLDTPLEELNLNWTEKDLPERERTKHVHRLHPYLGKYIPQLVEIFLRKYFAPGQTVLDPFCGSGTTLVQANELGINSIGVDISAFNILLGHAKTANYDVDKAKKEILDILGKVADSTQQGLNYRLWDERLEPQALLSVDKCYLEQWFAPQALRELLAYCYYIEIGSYQYRDLLKIILSRSARSARLTTHFDLDFPKKPQTEPYYCYKHSRICHPIEEAYKFLRRYSLDTISRIREYSMLKTDASVAIHHADSREISFPSLDGVITSPPYVGLIDYHEQHAYAYHLLGLKDLREQEIGPAARGNSQKAQQEYQQDIAEVFGHILQSMPSGGRLIVVANDRANLYGDIADSIGVEVEDIVKRHVNRRTGRRSTEFFESVFIWRKK